MKIIRRRCRTAKMLDRLLLFLLLAGIVVFILYPLVSLIGRSVFKNGMFTLEYYRELFSLRCICIHPVRKDGKGWKTACFLP